MYAHAYIRMCIHTYMHASSISVPLRTLVHTLVTCSCFCWLSSQKLTVQFARTQDDKLMPEIMECQVLIRDLEEQIAAQSPTISVSGVCVCVYVRVCVCVCVWLQCTCVGAVFRVLYPHVILLPTIQSHIRATQASIAALRGHKRSRSDSSKLAQLVQKEAEQ